MIELAYLTDILTLIETTTTTKKGNIEGCASQKLRSLKKNLVSAQTVLEDVLDFFEDISYCAQKY